MPRKRRGAGEGTVFQEKPGKWRASLSLGFRNGERLRKTFTAATRREVQENLAKALRDHQLGIPIVVERQTLGQYLHAWLEHVAKRRTRPRTFNSYEWIVNRHLAPGLGRVPLAKLSPQQLQEFLNERLEAGRLPTPPKEPPPPGAPSHPLVTEPKRQGKPGLTPRTVQHIHATLRVALGQAEKWGLVARNIATFVKPPRVPRAEIQPFTPEQARQFLDSIRGDRLEALYSVAMAIGLRQGEALGLRWSDIDMNTGTLTVNHALQRIDGRLRLVDTKRDRSRRTIMLPQVCVSALWSHHARQEQERLWAGSQWRETGFLFSTTVGTPLDGPTVTHRFQKALKKAGLPHLRFHDLRHACATLLLAQGVHPRIVMDVLGHSQISVTMNTYSHVIPAMQKETAKRMDEILRPVATSLATSGDATKVS